MDDKLIFAGEYTSGGTGRGLLFASLAERRPPIFAATTRGDRPISGLRQRGIDCPRDVSVIARRHRRGPKLLPRDHDATDARADRAHCPADADRYPEGHVPRRTRALCCHMSCVREARPHHARLTEPAASAREAHGPRRRGFRAVAFKLVERVDSCRVANSRSAQRGSRIAASARTHRFPESWRASSVVVVVAVRLLYAVGVFNDQSIDHMKPCGRG